MYRKVNPFYMLYITPHRIRNTQHVLIDKRTGTKYAENKLKKKMNHLILGLSLHSVLRDFLVLLGNRHQKLPGLIKLLAILLKRHLWRSGHLRTHQLPSGSHSDYSITVQDNNGTPAITLASCEILRSSFRL